MSHADFGHIDPNGMGTHAYDLHNDFIHMLDDMGNGHDWQQDFSHIIQDLLHSSSADAAQETSLEGSSAVGALDGHLQQFNTHVQHDGVIGQPQNDLADWHLQNHDDTCAVVSQEFVLHELTGQHVSEEQLRQEAMAHGWYTPGGGTPLQDVGALLALHGIPVEQQYGATLQQLVTQLQEGHGVIVGVNGEDIWAHNQSDTSPLSSYPGIPGQGADHAVEVIGIDTADPHGPMVILNDPGHPDGRGLEIPVSQFMQAWSTSDNYMVTAGDVGTAHDVGAATLGGYYNADGTYHYDSDNTDRDSQTGAVIRQW